jgi:hypothetical protein
MRNTPGVAIVKITLVMYCRLVLASLSKPELVKTNHRLPKRFVKVYDPSSRRA